MSGSTPPNTAICHWVAARSCGGIGGIPHFPNHNSGPAAMRLCSMFRTILLVTEHANAAIMALLGAAEWGMRRKERIICQRADDSDFGIGNDGGLAQSAC